MADECFIKDKKLHLVFGDLHQPAGYPAKKDIRGADRRVDRRLYPVKTGGRESGEAHEWRIVSGKGPIVLQLGRGDARLLTMLAAVHESDGLPGTRGQGS